MKVAQAKTTAEIDENGVDRVLKINSNPTQETIAPWEGIKRMRPLLVVAKLQNCHHRHEILFSK